MKRPTETITLADYRRLTTRPKRTPRADIPRAPADERVGLTPLLRRGWSPSSPDSVRYRLVNRDVGDTGLCATLREACDAAKRMEGA